MKTTETKDEICCPRFDPTPWDDKMITWENKRFIKDSVCTLFYMPLNFGAAMRRLNKRVDDAHATVPDWLCLSDHTSKWKMNLYLAVDKEIAGTENMTISGEFYCKVYEGPFKETGNWQTDFAATLKSKNLNAQKIYMWYTTCPKCAKKYGKNYTVFLAQIEPK